MVAVPVVFGVEVGVRFVLRIRARWMRCTLFSASNAMSFLAEGFTYATVVLFRPFGSRSEIHNARYLWVATAPLSKCTTSVSAVVQLEATLTASEIIISFFDTSQSHALAQVPV